MHTHNKTLNLIRPLPTEVTLNQLRQAFDDLFDYNYLCAYSYAHVVVDDKNIEDNYIEDTLYGNNYNWNSLTREWDDDPSTTRRIAWLTRELANATNEYDIDAILTLDYEITEFLQWLLLVPIELREKLHG